MSAETELQHGVGPAVPWREREQRSGVESGRVRARGRSRVVDDSDDLDFVAGEDAQRISHRTEIHSGMERHISDHPRCEEAPLVCDPVWVAVGSERKRVESWTRPRFTRRRTGASQRRPSGEEAIGLGCRGEIGRPANPLSRHCSRLVVTELRSNQHEKRAGAQQEAGSAQQSPPMRLLPRAEPDGRRQAGQPEPDGEGEERHHRTDQAGGRSERLPRRRPFSGLSGRSIGPWSGARPATATHRGRILSRVPVWRCRPQACRRSSGVRAWRSRNASSSAITASCPGPS